MVEEVRIPRPVNDGQGYRVDIKWLRASRISARCLLVFENSG
jgi:hypothetical protein